MLNPLHRWRMARGGRGIAGGGAGRSWAGGGAEDVCVCNRVTGQGVDPCRRPPTLREN